MKKDHIRDYATEAFRFYAKTGGRESYIKTLMQDIQKQPGTGVCSPTESAIISKEKVIESRAAEFADIEAVDKVLSILEMSSQGRFIREAIERVYFKDCWKDIGRGDMSDRVHSAELGIPASQRQIYYWLKKARRLFAEERGLRF
ncbi:hypothetical protein [Petroclostridium sp. X23]|uniref:hypothetical protein n=1 Tax=Petroclostridium sp. X23 TaxID=3045146 RepID=UPI0024AE7D41|nr:hypothetical protein [Petroclostridium sp. X23]WHH58468.1 hypothetical protein QKW49_22145 [Petroclostridium sp. X23]